MLNEWIIC